MDTPNVSVKNIVTQYQSSSGNAWLAFFLLIYVVSILKLITIRDMSAGWLFATYSVGVSIYILSRFALAYFHDPEMARFDPSYEPTATFGVPSKNEEANIHETIMRIAMSEYPKDKFNIIAIDDGSTDNTYNEMKRAERDAKRIGVEVRVIQWKRNRGKREGMAECVRLSDKDIIIFIDSDSFVESDTARQLMKYFIDPRVAAVAGHGFVANAETNMLTKMQAVRYFVSFKAYKGSESLFGTVTCCSGCCSAYRRSAVMEVLEQWVTQRFLGVLCTYGDDRSLTNYLLIKNYVTLYAPEAIVHTFVPETLRQFMKQQLRWKKSWIRENSRAALFMWKRNPVMSFSFYLGFVLPLMAPLVVARALLWYPLTTGTFPFFYVFGLLLMAAIYGLYYYIYMRDRKWLYGVVFASFYTLVLIWQLPYAILHLRDASWGTR